LVDDGTVSGRPHTGGQATPYGGASVRQSLDGVIWTPRDGTDPAVVGWAREWGRRALPGIVAGAVRSDLGHDVDLMLSELVTNALHHGEGVEQIQLRAVDAVLRVSVSDLGEDVPVVRPPADPRAEHGRGMLLVAALTRRWGVHRNRDAVGKVVWLELGIMVR
jgi:anti-sigma regulatory factor (Ser/Thr protein kinase)